MKRWLWVLGVVAAAWLMGALQSQPVRIQLPAGHPPVRSGIDLPVDTTTYFGTSGVCAGCHGYDPLGIALIDSLGQDINMTDQWRSTLMANSAKDPFWRAKVSHEVLTNPAHQAGLEDKCTSCHAPAGHFNAKFHGQSQYGLADLYADTMGLDGVNCVSCHMLPPDSVGLFFSGDLRYDRDKTIWGPYPNPFQGPMSSFVKFSVEYGPHVAKSELCAGCHSLITETVDLSGQYTGGEFIEQATYHEWKNSLFAQTGVECGSCHIPRTDQNVIIAANYAFLAPRRPYGKHDLVGGNGFMLDLMRTYKDELGIWATDAQMDSTYNRTMDLLQHHTANVGIALVAQEPDTSVFEISITNLAGHKFPSGFPSRRAFLEIVARNELGDTVFHSGATDANGALLGQDAPFEQHHNILRSSGDVQIYELIMADVQGNPTTVLERAASALKDNRLLPEGFSQTLPVYDTTRIYGQALNDPDFVGGSDRVEVRIAHGSGSPLMVVEARLMYQTVPPEWLEDLFLFSSAEIDTFQAMYSSMDRKPLEVASAVFGFIGIPERTPVENRVYPNPVRTTGVVHVSWPGVSSGTLRWVDDRGRVCASLPWKGNHRQDYPVPASAGSYFLIGTSESGQIFQERVVVLP